MTKNVLLNNGRIISMPPLFAQCPWKKRERQTNGQPNSFPAVSKRRKRRGGKFQFHRENNSSDSLGRIKARKGLLLSFEDEGGSHIYPFRSHSISILPLAAPFVLSGLRECGLHKNIHKQESRLTTNASINSNKDTGKSHLSGIIPY